LKADFDDSPWRQGPAPFGTLEPAVGRHPGTQWTTSDIYLRRTFDLPDAKGGEISFLVYHDEDVELYVNGVPAGKAAGFTTAYLVLAMTAEGKAALKSGKNTLAVHCHQTVGGQYIDVGIVRVGP
jgi:hypothetical protein